MKNVWLKIHSRLTSAQTVVIIEKRIAKKVKGNVSARLLNEFNIAAKMNKIENGIISIKEKEGFHTIHFKGSFSNDAKQKFRNIWKSQPERKIMTV